MPGVPASVTYATHWPSRTASTTQSALSCSLCACTDRSRPAAGTPRWVSRPRVRRVSSAAITSASRSASAARDREVTEVADGRGDEHQLAVLLVLVLLLAHARSSTRSPTRSRQRSNAPASASITNAARCTPGRHPPRRQRHRAQHDALGVAERDVDREPHAHRVHVAGTAGARTRPRTRRDRGARVDAPSPSRPLRPLRARHRRARARACLLHPRHTLKRISRTSPSTTS